MMYLRWEKSYNTQVEIIDSQLMDIMEIINLINKSIETEKDNHEIFAILQSLIDYTRYHYITESEIIYHVSRPYRQEQTTECEYFIRAVNNYLSLLNTDYEVPREKLVLFLNKWIQRHIENINKCIKQCKKDNIAV